MVMLRSVLALANCMPVGTPRYIVEGDSIPLHNAHTLPIFYIPHTESTIFTATEESTTIGRKGETVDDSCMSMQ